MKVLLLGNRGKLGSEIERYLISQGISYTSLNSDNFDALKPKSIDQYFENNSYDIVFNTVVYNGINKCAQYPEMAHIINVNFAGHIASLCEKSNSKLVYFSTEAVFGHKDSGEYFEEDIPAPVNTYGQTKFDGEVFSQNKCKNTYIFRLPILYGPMIGKHQIIETMILKMIRGEEIWVNDSVFTSPTFVKDIPPSILDIINNKEPGIYHITNEGKFSLKSFLTLFNQKYKLDYEFKDKKPESLIELEPKLEISYLKSNKIAPLRKVEACLEDYVIMVQNYIKEEL